MQVKIQIVFYRPFIKTDIKKHIIYTAKAIQRECCIFPDLKGERFVADDVFFLCLFIKLICKWDIYRRAREPRQLRFRLNFRNRKR